MKKFTENPNKNTPQKRRYEFVMSFPAKRMCPFVNDVRLKKRKIFCQKEERSDE